MADNLNFSENIKDNGIISEFKITRIYETNRNEGLIVFKKCKNFIYVHIRRNG